MNKILILIGSILLLGGGLYSCSDAEIEKEGSLIPTNPGIDGEDKLPNDMWGWVGMFPGEVSPTRERFDDVSVIVKGSTTPSPSFIVESQPEYWQSTGLYVVPAEPIDVIVPEGITGDLYYVIGVADISLSDITVGLKRYSEVTKKAKLQSGLNVLSNNFGGHLYFFYEGTPNESDVTLTVNGAVKSFDFIAGQTDLSEWTEKVKDTLDVIIWGELIGDKVGITLPIEELREINNPEVLLAKYDDLISSLSTLWMGSTGETNANPTGIPLWRIYADKQLPANSAAFSGYPLGLDMENVNLMKAFREMAIPSGAEAQKKIILNALGANYLTPWYKSNALTVAVPQLSSYYISNEDLKWPSDFSAVSLTERRPSIGNYSNFEAFADKFKVRMLLQLVQEYGWGLLAYVNDVLGSDYAIQLTEDKVEVVQVTHNDLFASAVTEYANINLTEFFEAWDLLLTSGSKVYMSKYPAPTSEFWNEFNMDMPELDRALVPVSTGRLDITAIKDTIYSPITWKAGTNSEYATAPVTRLIDGFDGSINPPEGYTHNWHNNFGDNNFRAFPYRVWFNFDSEDITVHELEFNYVILVQVKGQNRDEVEAKEFTVDIWEGDDWVPVNDGRVFFLGNGDGDQRFYLDKIYKSTGVRINLLNSHLHPDGDHSAASPGRDYTDCNLAEFKMGLITEVE